VEYAGTVAVIQEVEIDFDDVVDMHEIAALLPGRITAGSLEQPDASAAPVLMKEVKRHRRHRTLVPFARAVDIEVAEARDLRSALGKHAPHILVEQILRIAID